MNKILSSTTTTTTTTTTSSHRKTNNKSLTQQTTSPITLSEHAYFANRHHHSPQQQMTAHVRCKQERELENLLNAAGHKSLENCLAFATYPSTCSEDSDIANHTKFKNNNNNNNKSTHFVRKILELEKKTLAAGGFLLSSGSPSLSSVLNFSSSGSSSSFDSRASPDPTDKPSGQLNEKAPFMYSNFKSCSGLAGSAVSSVFKSTMRSRQVIKLLLVESCLSLAHNHPEENFILFLVNPENSGVSKVMSGVKFSG